MKRTVIEKSSMFKSVAYDPFTETLELEFNNGNVYQYAGVTDTDWNKFCRADSKGKHFAEFIRGKYDTKRIEETKHGETCPKLPHSHPDTIEYGHDFDFDGPFELQGVKLCGRCHGMLA